MSLETGFLYLSKKGADPLRTKYVIERSIPDDDLRLIGCYLQTCAHIEHSLWLYYFLENPVEADDPQERTRILGLRLQTQPLIKALKDHLPKLDVDEAGVLASIIAEVEEGLQTRHSIVHGALAFNGEAGGYVLHHHWKPDRKKKEYVNFRDPLPASHLTEAMDSADSILVRAHDLYLRAKKRAADREQSS